MPPKCPHCKVELEYTECCQSRNDGDYHFETWGGFCPKCHKNFFWDEIYTFSRCDNIEEVEELE